MILVIQLPCFIFFPVDRHFVFFLTLKSVAKFQWTSLYSGLPWPVISLSAVSLYLRSMMVQKLLSGKVQKWATYICFYLLAILMKSLTVLLHPSQDMTHPFVQRVSPISHFVDIFVVRSTIVASQYLRSSRRHGPEVQESWRWQDTVCKEFRMTSDFRRALGVLEHTRWK